jgi:hypothetical protein
MKLVEQHGAPHVQQSQTVKQIPLQFEVVAALSTAYSSWPKRVMVFDPALGLGNPKLGFSDELAQVLLPLARELPGDAHHVTFAAPESGCMISLRATPMQKKSAGTD